MGWAVHEASMYYKFLKKDQLLLFADECIEEADKMINRLLHGRICHSHEVHI